MEQFKIDTQQLADLSDAFKELPEKIKDNILRTVHRKLAKEYVQDPMKSNLPYSSVHKKDYVIQTDKKDKTGVIVGISSSPESWMLRFPEGGTKPRYAQHYRKGTYNRYGSQRGWSGRVKYKKPAYRGQINAQNNFQNIVDSNVPKIIDKWNNEIGELILTEIQKRINRINKKLSKI